MTRVRLRAGAEAEDVIRGLAQIRAEFDVPADFPPDVLAVAAESSRRAPTAEHVDRTDLPFVTLDPATSTDLDQAFCMESAGDDIILRYAIADVAHFVHAGDAVDGEAWRRGVTLYLPDGRAGLHPPVLAEGAASLLPDGPRPATIFVVRLAPDGTPRLEAAERAVVRSRAKLAYTTVTPADLPPQLDEFARRMQAADVARGASRIEAPEQVVETVMVGGHTEHQIAFRPRLWSEEANSALSLATNLAVADALLRAKTGLFRVMPPPDEAAIRRLRHTARALGLEWHQGVSLVEFERTLDPARPEHASFVLAIRRAGGGAHYARFEAGVVPWHAAMAAPYAHVTAPLRRLADRYVIAAVTAVCRGQSVPDEATSAFASLPDVMERTETAASRIDHAVIDLVEAVVLQHRVGSTFAAVVTDTDERGARIQLCDVAVVGRVLAPHVSAGDSIRVKLTGAEPERRAVSFTRVA